VLTAPFWDVIAAGREKGRERHENAKRLVSAVREAFDVPHGNRGSSKLRSLLRR
jgi:hypothetical protein